MRYVLFLLLVITSWEVNAQDTIFSRKGLRVIEPVEVITDNNGNEWFSLHMQGTYINQYKPAINASYSGANSLKKKEEREGTMTATLYLGLKLWEGGALYFNPEISSGAALSNNMGLSASANGEAFHLYKSTLDMYVARGYFVQTIGIGRKLDRRYDEIKPAANVLSTYQSQRYLRFYLGRLALNDIFDKNRFANSPRTQFINSSLMNNSSWDFAADTRGYTYAFISELQSGKMNYKLGVATLPTTVNGIDPDFNLGESFSLNAEATRTIKIKERPGNLRLLAWYHKGYMGDYKVAIASLINPPFISTTRAAGRQKYGFALSADQQLTDNLGMFVRVGYNDGATENICFTEASRTASLGLSTTGAGWKRPEDNAGIAVNVNGISDAHRRYLTLGGYGFMLGDGTLNYAPEAVGELYYSFKPVHMPFWFTAGYQLLVNPGFNADRGPAHVLSIRGHISF